MADNHMKTGGEQIEYKNKVASGNDLSVSEEVMEAFAAIKFKRKHRYVIFKVSDSKIEVDKLGDRNESYEDMKKALPFTDCRYIVLDLETPTADRGMLNKLWFILWMPNNANTYNKMAYSSAKGKMLEQQKFTGIFEALARDEDELDTNLGVKVESKDDEEDEDEDWM